jgi:hypothetical protein
MFRQRVMMNTVGIAAIVAIPLAVAAAPQWPHHGWHHGGPMFTRIEARVTGTVEAVQNLTGRDGECCCGADGGTHVTIKTAAESIEVHLGPAVWLREQGVTLTAGDVVDIVGWRVTMRGTPVLWAREITKGATTWTLRAGAERQGWGHCW